MLKSLQSFFNNTQPFFEEDINDFVLKLTKAKQLNQYTLKKLRTIISKANRILIAKFEILNQSNEKITLNNERHKNMLFDIWNHLCPNQPINMIDKQWCNIY